MQALIRRGGARTDGDSESEAGSANASKRAFETDSVLDLRTTEEPPVDAVFEALDTGSEGADLVVVTSAAPIPLYDRLDERGWSYEAVRSEADEWRIHITTDEAGPSGERLRRPRRRGHE